MDATPAIIQKAQGYKAIFQDYQTRAKNIVDTETSSGVARLQDQIVRNYIKSAEDEAGTAGLSDGKYYPYDVKGEPHIGYGHKLTKEEIQSGEFLQGISANRREQILTRDISEHRKRARSSYGNREFDRLSPGRQALLTDYAYLGVGKEDPETGEKSLAKTELLKKIKKGQPDEVILEEAGKYGGSTEHRQNLRKKMFSKLEEAEISPVRGMLAVMDQFHKGESKEILNTLYPSVKADRQINAWKSELDKFKNKLESNNFTEDDLFKLEGIIAHQFRETIGGLT